MTLELDLQAAVITKLSRLPYPRTSTVPQLAIEHYGLLYPLLTINSTVIAPLLTDELDKHSASITVQSWSLQQGLKEIYEMQGAVYNALHNQALDIIEYGGTDRTFDNFLLFRESSGVFGEEDGTFRGACTYRALLQAE